MPGASPTDETVTEPAADLAAEPASKLNGRRIAIIAAIAVLVLGGIGAGVYFLTKGDDKPASQGSAGQQADPAPNGQQRGSTPTSAAAPDAPTAADAGSAKQVAEKAIQAFNAHDAQAMKKISCDPQAILDNLPPEARVELAGNPELTGDNGSVEIKLIIGDQSTTTPLPLRKNNGVWCVE
jgi:hypothetical protein